MPRITNKLRLGRIRDILLEKFFPISQKLGFHILLNNYYSPIPDTRTLNEELWSKPSELLGVKMNEQKQLELLSNFVSSFKNEYEKFPKNKTEIPYQYYLNNRFFRSVDAEVLYCMIRRSKPRKVLEIGSGYSTFVSAEAILRNKQENNSYECELVAIDPYPNEILKTGFPGLSELIIRKVQDVPLLKFQELKENDILFIDSSHILKIGSDVHYEYLEILPRLNNGVLIHSHDIFLPAEYHKDWIYKQLYFFNEQYLLQSFLAFNDSFEVLWAGSYISLKHPDRMKTAFSSYERGDLPASFWIRRVSTR